jgi:hypothetical protein
LISVGVIDVLGAAGPGVDRHQVGPSASQPLKELFSQFAALVADVVTPGAFLGRWRLERRREGVGRPGHGSERGVPRVPGAGKGGVPTALPKAKVVTVTECTSHAPVLAAVGPSNGKGSG